MTSDSGLLRLATGPAIKTGFPHIASIGVTTGNRLPLLKRCLASYVSHLRQHGRTCDVTVMDDSEGATAREACRQWLRSFGQRFNVCVFYGGREEKLAYIDRVADRGIAPELVRFLLTNPLNITSSPGSNRNALLLDHVGKLVLTSDDDSVCCLADLRCGSQLPRVVPCGNYNLDVHFPQSRRASIDCVTRASSNVLAAHEELLGQSLNDMQYQNATIGIGNDLISERGGGLPGEGATTRITLSGVLGDCGMPNMIGFMFARGHVRQQFIDCWMSHGNPNTCRNVVRGVCRPIVSPKAGVMMTTATGLDNRIPLPPFAPSGRGEDTLFGVTAQKCFPDLYTGFVPFALLHAPEGLRRYERLGTRFRMADITMMILREYQSTPNKDSADQLKSLGQYLIRYASVAPAEFRSVTLESARASIQSRIDTCELYLQQFHSTPTIWAREIQEWLVRLELCLVNTNLALPIDLERTASDNQGYMQTQKFVRSFGEVLQHWPEITSAAVRLRDDGLRLSRQLN